MIPGDDVLLEYIELRSNIHEFCIDLAYRSGKISRKQRSWVRTELFVQVQEANQRWSKVHRIVDDVRAADEELLMLEQHTGRAIMHEDLLER